MMCLSVCDFLPVTSEIHGARTFILFNKNLAVVCSENFTSLLFFERILILYIYTVHDLYMYEVGVTVHRCVLTIVIY